MRKNIETADEILDKYFPVLDYGFLALVDYMGGDESIEKFARVSYGGGTRKVSDTKNLIRYLVRNMHVTPLESTELTFHIGLPIHCARQLIRHRTFSVNEFSARYSILPDITYTPKPENFGLQAKNNKQGRSDVEVESEDYDYFMNEIQELRQEAFGLYHKMLDKGVAREVARMDLPLSTYTYWYFKCDANNLMKMLKLRCDGHAQWEIRQYANVIAGMFKRVCPITFEAWYDYMFTASNFTRLDKELLQLICGDRVAEYDLYDFNTRAIFGERAKNLGISQREYDEFWAKLAIPESREFDLDLSTAKDASYYEQIVKDHTILENKN